MTVESNQSKYIYDGNGTTGPWNYPRYFIQDSDLLVTKTDALGNETTLTITSNYTVFGAGVPAGGYVTTTANISVGEKLTVSGNVDYLQGDSYPETGLLPAKTVERGLDRLTMMVQQINEKITRAFKLKISSTAGEVIVDDPVEGNILVWVAGRLANVTAIASNLLTAFYQDASSNVSVGRPGSVTAGHKLDVNGKLFVQNGANINTSGDTTGTDSINIYGQIDAYQPNSAMGAVGTTSVPGISASSSRGTGAAPTLSLANDLLGGTSMYAYSGASAGYNCHAAIMGRATGAAANNLGGALEFYTKADGGALTLRATMDNAGIMAFTQSPTMPTASYGNSTTNGATTAFVQQEIATQKTRLSSNFNKTDTTLSNTSLSVNLAANVEYFFRMVLFVDLNVAASGHKYALSGTATGVFLLANLLSIDNTSNAITMADRISAYNAASGVTGGTSHQTTIEGYISATFAGTLVLQFAQQAASGGTSTIGGGSYIILTRLV